MDGFSEEGLMLAVHEPTSPTGDGAMYQVIWTGRSTSRDPARLLLPWFQPLLEKAKAAHARVELHFEALEHFNSSTIAALIQLINEARTRTVAFVIHYDGSLRWQAASFQGLQRAMQPFDGKNVSKVDFIPHGAAAPR